LICVWIKNLEEIIFMYIYHNFERNHFHKIVSNLFNNLKMVSLGVLGLGEDEGECLGGWCEVTGPKTGGCQEGRESPEPCQRIPQARP
jgi:hypothetical protein